MQLVDLEHLQQVLQEFAVEVRNLYQDNLITHDHIASGDLLNSVECRVETEDRAFLVQLTLEDYWKYVEDGLAPAGKYPNPGWKAFPHILNWVTVKPVIPKRDNGRIPTPKSLAFLITRKSERGHEGQQRPCRCEGRRTGALPRPHLAGAWPRHGMVHPQGDSRRAVSYYPPPADISSKSNPTWKSLSGKTST